MSEQQSAREHHRGIAQRLASNLAGLAHNHLSLFGLELQDEKERLVKVLILVLVGAFVVWLGLAVLSVALVWWVAEEWRWAALLGVAIVYLAGGALSLYTAWQTVVQAAHPFAHTLDELRKDREQFLP
ncbi:phage holin family protein [Silvimonas sp. JCM 19000]